MGLHGRCVAFLKEKTPRWSPITHLLIFASVCILSSYTVPGLVIQQKVMTCHFWDKIIKDYGFCLSWDVSFSLISQSGGCKLSYCEKPYGEAPITRNRGLPTSSVTFKAVEPWDDWITSHQLKKDHQPEPLANMGEPQAMYMTEVCTYRDMS